MHMDALPAVSRSCWSLQSGHKGVSSQNVKGSVLRATWSTALGRASVHLVPRDTGEMVSGVQDRLSWIMAHCWLTGGL